MATASLERLIADAERHMAVALRMVRSSPDPYQDDDFFETVGLATEATTAVHLHHAALGGRVSKLNDEIKELRRLLDGRKGGNTDG